MEKRQAITQTIREHFEQQVDFLRRLVQAKSANPFTPETSLPSLPVEEAVASLVQQELSTLGFRAELHGVTPQRPNVVCHVPGSGKAEKTLILTTHMDTIEPDGYTRNPWGGQIEAGRLYGVGAADAKAQIAAFIYAVAALHRLDIKLDGNLTLAFVVDEEPGACSPYGTKYLLEQGLLSGDAAILGEPGNQMVAIGHRGLYRFRLTTYGEATHTGIRAWEMGTRGHNAILDMARVAVALAESALPGSASPAFPRRKSVLTFPTLIRGGSGINIVPGSCEAYGDVRLIPGTSSEEIKHLIKKQLARVSINYYRLDDLVVVPPAETDPQAEIVQTLAAAVEAVTSTSTKREGSGPACDGWMFITRGIPTVCGYGVTHGGVHGADEWADLESLCDITEVYAHTILHFLGEKLPEC